MEEYHQVTIDEYLEWKEDLRRRMAEAASNFVGIGYRLKQIRDSRGYERDGYATVFEFAEKELGISASQASRFMAINDKFSKGGNSLEMPEEYTKLGPTKLSEMLTLPEKDYQYITENTTKEQIRELKEFGRHEEEFMNPPEDAPESIQESAENVVNQQEPSNIGKEPENDGSGSGIIIECLNEFLKRKENEHKFNRCLKAKTLVEFAKTLNPTGSALMKSGRHMLFLRKPGEKNPMKVLGGTPSEYTWEEIHEAFYDAYDGFESWEEAFALAQGEKPENADKAGGSGDFGSETEEKCFTEGKNPRNADKAGGSRAVEGESEEECFTDTKNPGNADKVSGSRAVEFGEKESGDSEGKCFTETEKPENADKVGGSGDFGSESEGKCFTDSENPGNPDVSGGGGAIGVTKSISLIMQETKESARVLMDGLDSVSYYDETMDAERLEDTVKFFQKSAVAFLCNLQDWKKAAEREEGR